nr:zinc finger, CCHC-type [Tanacetum cinerariifolium]
MAGNTVKEMTTNFRKLDKFEGHDFRRWQKKMHFLLTTLKVVYVLTTPMPELVEDATVEAIRIWAKWENDDYICRGYILNGMSDSLFDVYMNVESIKELWDSFESKYMAEDSSNESLRAQDSDKRKGKEVGGPSVNMTEEGKNKHNKQNKGIAVVVKRTTQMLVIRERGLRTNPKTKVDANAWWIDSGATTHVCKDHCCFKTFELVEDGSVLYMGDEHFALVHGKGSVALEFSSGKLLLCLMCCEKGIDCIFVGYAEHSKAYRFYVIEPNDPVSINSIIESRDAIFYENHFSSIPRPKDIIPNVQESQIDDHTNDVLGKILEPQKGFRQKKGIDYFDTYAPVARITTIILLLTLAAIHNLVIHQIDVKISFLNGNLDDELYMKQPEGFVMLGNKHKACKLVKSLYGLKQAPKQWHQKLTRTDQNQVDEIKKFLSSRFLMKDMGEADVILGIKIKHKNKGIVITQSHYIEKILKKFNRKDCSSVSTPIDPVEKLKPNTEKPVDQLEYSRAIGCLMYAITSTRPDIAYAIGRLSRLTSNTSRQHYKAITRVFKYLRGTKDYGLSYVGYPSVLEGYSDASWINHVEDSSSTSGWVFLFGGGAITWASKKQTRITSSTMEFEFVALDAAGKEAKWLRNLIHEISIWPKPITPISIRCDSAPMMAMAYSQIYNGKFRHLGPEVLTAVKGSSTRPPRGITRLTVVADWVLTWQVTGR